MRDVYKRQVYVFVGGLKACAWTDLFWGAALIVGGGVVAYFALTEQMCIRDRHKTFCVFPHAGINHRLWHEDD